jgi:hypothetical protein
MLIIAAPHQKPISMMKRISFYLFSVLSILFFFQSIADAHDRIGGSGKKVACFLADKFPTVDAPGIDPTTLKGSLQDFDVEYFKSIESLNTNLTADNFRVVVLPYGSAFPVDGWQAIQKFHFARWKFGDFGRISVSPARDRGSWEMDFRNSATDICA